jgi:MraZ protein
MTILTGEAEYAVDDKGRLVLPQYLRERFADGLVTTRGLEGCLYVFPLVAWGELEQQMAALPLSDGHARAFIRFFYSGATRLRLDHQGRLNLPPALRAWAQIEDRAVLAPTPTRLELWRPALWEAELRRFTGEIAVPASLHGLLR